MDVNSVNVLVMAYLGDAIYELYIRKCLIAKGIAKVDDLQKAEVFYVSAKGQARILNRFLDEGILSEDEISVVMRGRNYRRSAHPKNTDLATYKLSTGFEALIGYLHLNGNMERLEELFSYIEVK